MEGIASFFILFYFIYYYFFFSSQRPFVPLLLLDPPFFTINLFLSTTLSTGMTGVSSMASDFTVTWQLFFLRTTGRDRKFYCPGGVVYVVSSPHATEETGAVGREIESRQGIRRQLKKGIAFFVYRDHGTCEGLSSV
jgi:hypothetical protein